MAKRKDDGLNGPLFNEAQPVQFTPYKPGADLAFFVESYWLLAWDLRNQSAYCAEHLPDSSVHVIVEDKISGVFGPAKSRFSRLVEGQGWAFCIKFRPGGFFPLTHSPVSELRN